MSSSLLSRFSTSAKFTSEEEILAQLVMQAGLETEHRQRICRQAASFVAQIRSDSKPTMMERFLSEYRLSTDEGIALMCLAEAMLRVPDARTIDALIEDKIAPSDWGQHLGRASSSFVNASTWALLLTGRVLDDAKPGVAGVLRATVKRLGEPVIRVAVGAAMKEMGRQFVLGETMESALARAQKQERDGYTYSYDMLGEAAITAADARHYAAEYLNAITEIARSADKDSVAENPGISIKLSALHPRYEVAQQARIMTELVPIVTRLARAAKDAGIGFNVDAEEQDRLVLSLRVIEEVLSDPELAGWDGFGVVVQAYGKRAGETIDWLNDLATQLDRKIMVRLVKGAYWDTEMKHAQVEGLTDFTLFTSKAATDVSYIANARKLFSYSDRIYPQFATHNAHSVAAILEIADGRPFEFQRLHGMGERLHEIVLKQTNSRCRIYAPVGAHTDLLAYLVRRLLENGANSSFVHQMVDESVTPETIAADPFEDVLEARPPKSLNSPALLFGVDRKNSAGFDLSDEETLVRLEQARQIALPDAAPITVDAGSGAQVQMRNPATGEVVGNVVEANFQTVATAIDNAQIWSADVGARAAILRKAADLFEDNFGLIFSVLAQEGGKTLADAIGELREAVDFLRYYATEAENHVRKPQGIFVAISPWNFPLAIFTGQIAAALACGNAVLAKPAEQTPIIGFIAVRLLHEAGVPVHALQFLPGQGAEVGAQLTAHKSVSGVVFTGSTDTALRIRRSMAEHLSASAPLIAETGGLNVMVVDSTALAEQAVRDIIDSAFRSAGQRCSALRCLYVQKDIAPRMVEMIKGAMDELTLGNPWHLATDVGPVIDAEAQNDIADYIAHARDNGGVLYELLVPDQGNFIAPTLIKVNGVADMEREIFGPVLHLATFEAEELNDVISDVNASGYGLTFGLHTRIDSRVQEIADGVHVGNVYVNRNQIGAIVGSQPFGGEGLSGTGPKAGGPNYLRRFSLPDEAGDAGIWNHTADVSALKARISRFVTRPTLSHYEMPGPTGEANTLTLLARDPIVCMGPGNEAMQQQIKLVKKLGGLAVGSEGTLLPEQLAELDGISGAIWWGEDARQYAIALASRQGPILPLLTDAPDLCHVAVERHLCVDTTAAGGNAALLSG